MIRLCTDDIRADYENNYLSHQAEKIADGIIRKVKKVVEQKAEWPPTSVLDYTAKLEELLGDALCEDALLDKYQKLQPAITAATLHAACPRDQEGDEDVEGRNSTETLQKLCKLHWHSAQGTTRWLIQTRAC